MKATPKTAHAVALGGLVRLDLSLEFCHHVFDPSEPDGPGFRKEPSTEKATLVDCARLLRGVEHWIGAAEAASRQIAPLEPDDPRLLQRFQALSFETARSPVASIHYGSPFEIQVLLGVLTPPGLGVLFYGAKRLFGADLEFRAYREQRRAEYLQAREIAEALERDPPLTVESQVTPWTEGTFHWRMADGAVTDESE
jgi:hypothetical protein